jgi:hypothetical protein
MQPLRAPRPSLRPRETELSDLHMLVLGRIAHHAAADAEDITVRRSGGWQS